MEFFVATPYELDPQFHAKKQIVERCAEEYRVTVRYATWKDAFDTDVAVGLLKSAEFVLGDLSYERPSCYFEIGFAQALGKPVDLIAVEGTNVHQVIGGERVRTYRNLEDYERLIGDLLEARVSGIQYQATTEGDVKEPVNLDLTGNIAQRPNPEFIAKLFHETYERLAPLYAFETRPYTRVAWDEVPERNKRLMIATAAEVLAVLFRQSGQGH